MSALSERVFRVVTVVYLGAVFLYLVAPILVSASISVTPERFLVFPPGGFSLRWYRKYLADPTWQEAIGNTVVVGILCAVIATVIGSLSAYGISRIERARWRDLAFVLFLIPLVVPYMTLAMALYPVYARAGLIGTRLGVALAQAVVALPYVVLAVTASMRRRDRILEAAARTLGASPVRAFAYVVLPLAWPGIAAGAVLAFMTSFDDVIMPLFLGGIGAGTVPKVMLDSLYTISDPSVMAVSASISAVGLVLLVVTLTLRGRGPA